MSRKAERERQRVRRRRALSRRVGRALDGLLFLQPYADWARANEERAERAYRELGRRMARVLFRHGDIVDTIARMRPPLGMRRAVARGEAAWQPDSFFPGLFEASAQGAPHGP